MPIFHTVRILVVSDGSSATDYRGNVNQIVEWTSLLLLVFARFEVETR